MREVEELERRPVASLEDSREENEPSTEEVKGSPVIPVVDVVSLVEVVEDENIFEVADLDRRPVVSSSEDSGDEKETSTEDVKGRLWVPGIGAISLLEGIADVTMFEVDELDRLPVEPYLEDSGEEKELNTEGVKRSPVVPGAEAVSLLEGIEDENEFEVEKLDGGPVVDASAEENEISIEGIT